MSLRYLTSLASNIRALLLLPLDYFAPPATTHFHLLKQELFIQVPTGITSDYLRLTLHKIPLLPLPSRLRHPQIYSKQPHGITNA